MTATIRSTTTKVPIADGRDVEISPGDPYPSPYRGSKYSIVDSKRHKQVVLRWKYNDLVVMVDPPEGLVSRLQEFGKSEGNGRGSIRVTAAGEVLTKIYSDNYTNTNKAPVSNGWIPVYIGELDGEIGFDIEINPSKPKKEADIWGGFSFNHGERWSVGVDDNLIWTWQDYRFESAFDHSDLVSTYQQYRSTAGRLYINEFKHVFINVPSDQVPASKQKDITKIYRDWQRRAERNNNNAAQQLVSRRLKVTGDGDPDEGHLPVYIGHLSEFDDGIIPRPVVTDESYFVKAARGEEVHG
jgi:hypothetical protein